MSLDSPHMVKCICNTFGKYKRLKNGDNLVIDWKYIELLNELQSTQKLSAANKLTSLHVKYHSQKMKVHLAVQLFSNSVANALDYCRDILKLPQFKGSEATSEFLRIINDIFDVLNSRFPNRLGSKAPMSLKNKDNWMQIFERTEKYILNLTDIDGKKVLTGRNKTGFLGILVNIHTFKMLFCDIVENGNLPFLLTYKCCQDHLESFFGCIRSRFGCNNNPTAYQFMTTFKRLLIGTTAKLFTKSSNVFQQDQTELLDLFPTLSASIAHITEEYNIDNDILYFHDHDTLTEYQTDIVEYIAGSVCTRCRIQ